ncbi:glyoxalase/bleomycin resistance/dioxygenase family protein [Grimontia kaedaensis]|uniref:Glyoxalase/bleomycin resistance/dioxygenase family protein n=1 Tax=Grimontia kaedaensis TaxID=2872157 RepID=A0ABY4WRY1_9GAMM|nr:glyoxalase/bleomycin resistance/dioxygenase family protein [Grimontia kaedaensis]USH01288.1 glyoxalase/bleomycin resistance/dioxygenase family protein [Grimontia kaedaensis]
MIPVAVLIHVPDIREGLKWYQKAFPEASSVYYPESDFTVLELNSISLEIVQADEKVSEGKKGTVVYWFVENWSERLSSLEALGAKLYRGPMVIEHGLIMCQLEDPFGNLIGLRGKVT